MHEMYSMRVNPSLREVFNAREPLFLSIVLLLFYVGKDYDFVWGRENNELCFERGHACPEESAAPVRVFLGRAHALFRPRFGL